MILTRFAFGLLAASLVWGQTIDGLELHGVRGDSVTYLKRQAVHLRPASDGDRSLALVKGPSFQDTTIEADVAGAAAAAIILSAAAPMKSGVDAGSSRIRP